MKKFIIFVFIILLNNSTSDAGVLSEMIKEKYHKYDLIHYDLNLDIDNKNHKIYADAEIYFKAKYDNLKSVYFLFNADFNVISVNRNEKLLKFSFQNLLSPMGALRIVLDNPLKINEECILKIKYIIEFKSPQILGAKSYIDEQGAELSPTGLWFPMMVDEECTFMLTIIAPEDRITIGTGELIEIKNTKKDQDSNFVQYKYEIKKPISPWAMSVCEHKYKKFSYKHKEYIFEIYVFEKQEKYVGEILKEMKFVFDFYEDKFGKFPIKKYIFLTIKEGSALAFYYHIVLNENIVENINAKDENAKLIWYRVLFHETGHLWAPSSEVMGNYSWLSEGLTEYLFFLAYQEKFGKENGKRILERWRNIYLNEIQKKGESPIIKTDILTPSHFGVVYNKGAYVFYMLRYILGDEKFYELIRNFSSKFKWKNALLSDFKNTFQEVVKEELDWFFKDWLESTKKLDYAISNVKSIKEKDGYNTTFTVTNFGEINMPIDVEILIQTKRNKEIKKVTLMDKTQNISFKTKDKITSITIDPNYWLLDINRENNCFSTEHFRNPRNIEGEYIIEIDKIKWLSDEDLYRANVSRGMPENFDKTIKIWLSVPKECDNQENVKILNVIPDSIQRNTEKENGNTIYFWDFNEKTAKEKLQIKTKFKFTSYEIFYEVNPELIGKYNKQNNDYQFYTKSEKYIEITQDVQKLAKEIVGTEVNSYYQAKKIFNWIIENMSYKFPVHNKGVTNALENRSGDCGEFSFVFIALCRSLGIPARMVLGGWAVPQKEGVHAWAEFYLPNYSWLPADPTVAQMVKTDLSFANFYGIPDNPEYYFCHLDNKRIIYSKGNNIKLEPAYPEKFSDDRKGRIIFLQHSRPFIWGLKVSPEVKEKLIIYE